MVKGCFAIAFGRVHDAPTAGGGREMAMRWTTMVTTGAAALVLAAAPARADVKAGVDAWERGDYGHAVAEWRPLAIAGDADAQFNMGQAYKLGHGVPIDGAQAIEWFRRAAQQDHVQAGDNLGLALFQARRLAEALPWLEKGAARGEPRTQLVLGTMLFNGDGVPRDMARGYALMSRASAAGLPAASQSLAQMDGAIAPADREHGLALAQVYAMQARPAVVAEAQAASRRTTPVRNAAPPAPAPRRAAATSPWRIQLGAFRDRARADALWAGVRGKLAGAHADYVEGGGFIRLQAVGFDSRAAATRACSALATPCVPVAP